MQSQKRTIVDPLGKIDEYSNSNLASKENNRQMSGHNSRKKITIPEREEDQL